MKVRTASISQHHGRNPAIDRGIDIASARSLPEIVVWLLVATLIGCGPAVRAPLLGPTPEQPQGFPADWYEGKRAAAEPVYQLLPESQVTVRVYRGGRAAKLGHNHVVVSRNIRGYAHLAPDSGAARIDLFLPVAALIVDDPADRAQAGEEFAKPLTRRAIDGTRENMLGEKVLHASQHPFVAASGTLDSTASNAATAKIKLTVRGMDATVKVPVSFSISDDRLALSGETTLRQSDFGIEPFSVLRGALVVQDVVKLRFDLEAARLPI